MARAKFMVALGRAEQAHLAALLTSCLRDEHNRLQRELEDLLAQASPDRMGLLQLLEVSHDLGEQADHLLLAIARNEMAQNLLQEAEEIFDGFRTIEATVADALARQRRL